MSGPVGKSLAIHVASRGCGEAIRIDQFRRFPGLALLVRQVSSLVTLRCHSFPLLERRILERFGSPPLLDAIRPADFGSLIPWFPYRVIRDRAQPAFLPGEAEDMIIDPILQADG